MRIGFFSHPLRPTFPYLQTEIISNVRAGHSVDVYTFPQGCDQRFDFVPAHLRHNVRMCTMGEEPKSYDVICAHWGPNAVRVAQWIRDGLLSGPLVATFHGYDVNQLPRERPLSYYRPVFEVAAAVTAGSSYMADILEWMGAPVDSLHVLPMPVDVNRFWFRPPRVDRAGVRFVSVGRLASVKGHVFAIEALAKIQHALPSSWSYTIVGEGGRRRPLQERIEALGVQNHVRLVGGLPAAEVVRVLHDHDVLIHPSIRTQAGDVEGQGLAIAEAMAAGLPVVASRIGGIPESVRGGHGFLCDAANVDSLADALLAMVQQKHRWTRMAEIGRKKAEQCYSVQVLSARRFALYASLLANA